MNNKESKYCISMQIPERLPTIEVKVGKVKIGNFNPIVVQSMTTADTMNTEATVEECIRMIDAGCELIRITAPSKNEAMNLQNIKDQLRNRNYDTPLVADIHFTPNAAEIAAKIVEKVRINPGNYADKKRFEVIEYTEESYQAELQKIEKRFRPLLEILKETNIALRIGTNHGSLSDRIMSKYGDSPLGMVESALEFVRFCEKMEFFNIVISMKASNTQVMVQAYRLLCQKMLSGETQKIYPLHLGVTEAGEGEDGRIKSAVGIGTLLADGIGDTIRVSLTEPPEEEIPVAKSIIQHFERQQTQLKNWVRKYPNYLTDYQNFEFQKNPFDFEKRHTSEVRNFGFQQAPRVIADFSHFPLNEKNIEQIGYFYNPQLDKWKSNDNAADYVFLKQTPPFLLPNGLRIIYEYQTWLVANDENAFPLFTTEEFFSNSKKSKELNFISVSVEEILFQDIEKFKNIENCVLVLFGEVEVLQPVRLAIFKLMENHIHLPVIYQFSISTSNAKNTNLHASFQIDASCIAGPLLIDGLIDGIWVKNRSKEGSFSLELINNTSFSLLQAARLRMTKTEYISCPSCGRTLFDLQTTTAMIRSYTEHLKGVKIGIMGCIVNGPGEMADADYGYVGSGIGTVTLYRGKEVVAKDIKAEFAVEKLIDLIREDGRWIEK